MAPKYILYFFDAKGCGEGIRYLLHYKKQEFDDHRIPVEQWPAMKLQMPAGQLPVLETGGQKLSQVTAIARYLGHELGLYPSSSWDQAKLDEAAGLGTEVGNDVARFFAETDPKKKESIRQEIAQAFPPKLAHLAKVLAISDQKPFIVGKKPTWADFVVASYLDVFNESFLQGQLGSIDKGLADYVQRIQQLENVKEYIAQGKRAV